MDSRRRALAIAWVVTVAFSLTFWLADEPLVLFLAWFTALLLLAASSALARPRIEERLHLPVAYRTVAAVAFALPLAGALLTQVPHASGVCMLFAPYFLLMAWLGYRTLVARSAYRALLTTTFGLLVWLPFCVFLGFGCKCGHPPPPHWTELATLRILLAIQLVNGFASAVALLSFAPRPDGLPEARVRAG
jgi:hypothetical protein